MKPASAWAEALATVALDDAIEQVKGQHGELTLKVGNVYLHSRYRPREEAARLVDSAELDLQRPVLVVGLGLGYHVLDLLERKAEVAVVEPSRSVARLALEGPMSGSDILLGLGEPETIAATPEFQAFTVRMPQILVHPASARVHPGFAEDMIRLVSRVALSDQRLGVVVVGPMYGGSLPVAHYLDRALRALGHRTLLVDNSAGWAMYDEVQRKIKTKKAASQLGNILANFLNQWSYARTVEYAPDICIVLAEAPVGPEFPSRLRKEGIVSAFWFVENWRHMPYWKETAPRYDFFFHIQPGEFEEKLNELGCNNHAFIPTGSDPEIHKPVELTEEERSLFGCDISFAGAGYYNRVQMFQGLTDYDFKIWGVAWDKRELRSAVQDPDKRFTTEEFVKIVAGSKINLNLHSSTTHPGVDPTCDAINPRVFDIAACGGFQLCDPCKNLERFFDFESELPTYTSLAELRAAIDHYLQHPEERRKIAERARARVLREHTYQHRAQQMLDLMLDSHGARILKKGIRVQRTVAEMAERVGRDTPLGRYLDQLPPDLLFTQEAINEQLTSTRSSLSYPEAVFTYLREVRDSTEHLLAARE